jgi:pilus assembly protein Flp/PilA
VKAKVLSILRGLHNDETGQDLVEYALIAALIALGASATMTTLASDINNAFSAVGSELNSTV